MSWLVSPRSAGLENLDLLGLVEILEDRGPPLRVGRPQDGPRLVGREPLHELRRPRRVHRGAELLEPRDVVRLEHFAEFGQ